MFASNKINAEQLRESVQMGKRWQDNGLVAKDVGIIENESWIRIQKDTFTAN